MSLADSELSSRQNQALHSLAFMYLRIVGALSSVQHSSGLSSSNGSRGGGGSLLDLGSLMLGGRSSDLAVESLGEARGNLGEGTGSGIFLLGSSDLGGVTSVTVTSSLGAHSDNSGVDGARDAVVLLEVELRQVELSIAVSGVILDILSRGLIDELLHLESLDGLVLRDNSAAVHAVGDVVVALILLASSVVSSLRWHILSINPRTLR